MTSHDEVVERLARDARCQEEVVYAVFHHLRPGDDLGNGLVAMPEQIKGVLAHTIGILESKEMQAAFVCAAIHGQEYRGEIIDMKQLRAMRRAAGGGDER